MARKAQDRKRKTANARSQEKEMGTLYALWSHWQDQAMKQAVSYYKRNHCGGSVNFNKTYNFHDYPYCK